jgi:hypothetical protein
MHMRKAIFLIALVVFLTISVNNALAGCQLAANSTELACSDITVGGLCTAGPQCAAAQ